MGQQQGTGTAQPHLHSYKTLSRPSHFPTSSFLYPINTLNLLLQWLPVATISYSFQRKLELLIFLPFSSLQKAFQIMSSLIPITLTFLQWTSPLDSSSSSSWSFQSSPLHLLFPKHGTSSKIAWSISLTSCISMEASLDFFGTP